MSSKSRRKTLCHSEIENFLEELQATNPVATSTTIFQDISSSPSSTDLDLKSMIRQYVKESNSSNNIIQSTETLIDLAHKVKAISKYGLLPKRHLEPKSFEHPAHTLEGKRSLLMSLTPMLEVSEKQRKIDANNCENATRCRIESRKTRGSWFQYFDFDIGANIDPSVYEERYLRFLSLSKNSPQNQQPVYEISKRALQPISQNVINVDTSNKNKLEAEPKKKSSTNDKNIAVKITDKEKKVSKEKPAKQFTKPKVIEAVDTNFSSELMMDDASESQINTNNSNKERDRRATLSPSKMKKMLEIVLSDDFDATESRKFATDSASVESSETIIIPNSEDLIILEVPSAIATSAEIKEELPLEEPQTEEVCEFYDCISADEIKISDENLKETVASQCISEAVTENTHFSSDPERIRQRLFLRFEIARWKYAWEIASLDAAQKANSKLVPANNLSSV